MLLTILFLLGSALLGLGIVHRCLPKHLNPVEKVLWGIVLGWSLSTAAVYLIARWQSKLTVRNVIWVTVVSFIIATPPLIKSIRELATIHYSWQPHITGMIVVLVLFTPIYWQLFSSHFFAPGPDGVYSGGSAYFDLSFHAAVSTSFLYGDNFPPAYSPSVGKPLLYPFLPDFQTAALMATGISMRSALLITSLILAMATTALLFYFALRVTAKPMVGILATILFLLNGGLGFIDLLRDWRSSGKGFRQFWSTLAINYANYSDHALHWPNVITDAFVPQRTFLFGLPLGLMVLTLFAAEWAKTDVERKRWQGAGAYLFAGFVTGLLPLFHVHTFIALGLVSGILFLLKPHRCWFLFWGLAILVAAPRIANLLSQANGEGLLRLQPGWMGHDSAFFPWYLLRNFGLPLLLAIPAWFLLERRWRLFYLALVFVFAFAFTVVFSPNLYDNGKLIYYWQALNCVVVANLLVKIAFAYRQSLIATVLTLLCIATGVAALQSEKLKFTLLFNNEEIAAASFAQTQTAGHALFLTAPVTNQPVLCLAGRQILRGPSAWLWSHGYEFRDREADVRRIYAGASDAQDLLKFYNVDYVFLSDVEREQLHAQTPFFDANFPAVYKSQTITIYDARKVKSQPSAARSLARRLEYDPFALFVAFPETSFFAYRALKATNGRMPTLAEFYSAMTLLTQDVWLESPGWKEQIRANQEQLISELAGKFSALSNADYVQKLATNTPGATDLNNQLVERLEQGSETRGTVLRRIIEDPQFYDREYNNAFVLVHFFGYLKRNPNDPPDSDLTGFDYWCNILNKSKDYRSISRAFLESEEYKRREVR